MLHAPPNTGCIKGTTRGSIGLSADRISILYYTKSWSRLSFYLSGSLLPSRFFPHLAPLSIRTVSSQRGIIRQKGVAGPKKGRRWFSSSCVPFVSARSRDIRYRPSEWQALTAAKWSETARFEDPQASPVALCSPQETLEFRTSAGIIDSIAGPRISVALNYLNCTKTSFRDSISRSTSIISSLLIKTDPEIKMLCFSRTWK